MRSHNSNYSNREGGGGGGGNNGNGGRLEVVTVRADATKRRQTMQILNGESRKSTAGRTEDVHTSPRNARVRKTGTIRIQLWQEEWVSLISSTNAGARGTR